MRLSLLLPPERPNGCPFFSKGSRRLGRPPCVFGVIPRTFGALGKGRVQEREHQNGES